MQSHSGASSCHTHTHTHYSSYQSSIAWALCSNGSSLQKTGQIRPWCIVQRQKLADLSDREYIICLLVMFNGCKAVPQQQCLHMHQNETRISTHPPRPPSPPRPYTAPLHDMPGASAMNCPQHLMRKRRVVQLYIVEKLLMKLVSCNELLFLVRPQEHFNFMVMFIARWHKIRMVFQKVQ